jgi:AcrR family transcriptional regulator
MKPIGLRERTRRAVQAALSEAAQELFVTQGFEATTVDQIAAAAGISPRSFFRYFASKEDVVLGRYDLQSDDLAAALSARPLDEPVWDSLRHTFDVAVDYYSDAHRLELVAKMLIVITSSPSLHARYLAKQDAMQQRLIDILCERAVQRGEPAEANDILTRAIVGSAYACLNGAIRAAFLSNDPKSLASRLDAVMTTLRPAMPDVPVVRIAPAAAEANEPAKGRKKRTHVA